MVDVRHELDAASVVAEVKILQYMDGRLWVQSLEDTFVRAEVRYADDPTWSAKPFVDDGWQNKKQRTGIWPPVGAAVLIVLDRSGVVSLFAQRVHEYYRFWSPQATGSMAMFACASAGQTLEAVPGKGSYYRNKSWDGCMMPAADITWKPLQQP